LVLMWCLLSRQQRATPARALLCLARSTAASGMVDNVIPVMPCCCVGRHELGLM
jgi:hypothetical protein